MRHRTSFWSWRTFSLAYTKGGVTIDPSGNGKYFLQLFHENYFNNFYCLYRVPVQMHLSREKFTFSLNSLFVEKSSYRRRTGQVFPYDSNKHRERKMFCPKHRGSVQPVPPSNAARLKFRLVRKSGRNSLMTVANDFLRYDNVYRNDDRLDVSEARSLVWQRTVRMVY